MDQLRQSAISQTEVTASKQRFALFSQPPPLAIGDDSKYKTSLHPRDQNGKPITQPRNFSVSPTKTGVGKSSYFKVPDSIYIGDPHIDPFRRDLMYQNKKYRTGKYHQSQFIPASGFKQLATSSYKYQPHGKQQQKKIQKDENGRVKTEPRNIQTNPCSKIQYQILKHPKHIEDPYNRKYQIQKQYQKKKRSKIAQNQFITMSHPLKTFDKPINVYGTDVKFSQKIKTQSSVNKTTHEGPFKPSKKYAGYLNKFPQYIPQLPKVRNTKKLTKDEKQVFKPPAGGNALLSRPTPSISLHNINLKKSAHF